MQLAADVERKAECLQSGLGDPFEDGKARLLKVHVEEFRRYLESKANSDKHVHHTCRRVEQSLLGCRFIYWADISSSHLLGWLADQRAAKKFGIKTSNHYLAAMKELCHWMVKDGRVPSSPLVHLHALNAETDVRRQRRALTADDFAALIKSAHDGRQFRESRVAIEQSCIFLRHGLDIDETNLRRSPSSRSTLRRTHRRSALKQLQQATPE